MSERPRTSEYQTARSFNFENIISRVIFESSLSICLYAAVATGRLDVVQLLVNYMSWNQIRLHRKLPPLSMAVQNRQREVAEWLIQQNMSLNLAANGVRPIAAAAAVGFTDLVQILLQKGIPADSANPDDRSGLVAALVAGKLQAAQLLLNAGVDTNVTIDDDPECTETVQETLLSWAAGTGSPDTVRFLLGNGWNVNGSLVITPLAYATASKQLEPKQLLITANADIEHRDAEGRTLLFHAVSSGSADAVRILLTTGADPDTFDVSANVNNQSSAGSTALINAASRAGVQLERTFKGRTALGWAVYENALNTAHALVQAGAQVTITDDEKETPLSLARNETALAILSWAQWQ
ncbi:ankyrin repeat-containing domain protein, partial [Aspergillus keveii]